MVAVLARKCEAQGNMSRASRSRQWHDQHRKDAYVQKALSAGFRSRATFKLKQLDERDALLRPGMTVLDLGAAPGGWSQYALERVGTGGLVVAVDRLEMAPLPGVAFIQGELEDTDVQGRLVAQLGGRRPTLVMSDMAPNLTGVRSRDEAQGEALGELTVYIADRFLADNGKLVAKTFHGRGFEDLRARLRERFSRVMVRKPGASKDRSSEVYLVAKGFGV